jgi:pimeloyl-ACP methyl ester carboxylesterase
MFSPAAAASKAGDSAQATRLLIGAANGQPDYFDTAAPALRSIWLDNARTVSLFFAAPPPPAITCEQLGQMKIPVTIARGELTRPYFRIAADTAAHCIPGSKVVIILSGRHLTPVEDAPAFNAALLSFLK